MQLDQQTDLEMSSEILAPPKMGTLVWLHSLEKLPMNGQRALVCQEDGVRARPGRCAVELLDPAEGRKVISIQLKNLSLTPPAHFCIKKAPGGRGMGVFATQDMQAGVTGGRCCSTIVGCRHALVQICIIAVY